MASTPLQTEAHSLYQGLREAFNREIRFVQIRSDCKELVHAIDSQQQPFEISVLVHDIKMLRLCSRFSYCIISKVSRQEVAPAHELATAARFGNLNL